MILLIVTVLIIAFVILYNMAYNKLESEVLKELGYTTWNIQNYIDDRAVVKSRQSLEKYDAVKYYKDNNDKLRYSSEVIKRKNEIYANLKNFLTKKEFKERYLYSKIEKKVFELLEIVEQYRIEVNYITTAGNRLSFKIISLDKRDIHNFLNDPTLLMTKTEYNKHQKELMKNELNKKHTRFYDDVNRILDNVDAHIPEMVLTGGRENLEKLSYQLYEGTINSIKKIKTLDSQEWTIIKNFISKHKKEINSIINNNKKIVEYYESENFNKIMISCKSLMESQKEFNEYISDKVQSISLLFGTRVVRDETNIEDEYNYVRSYKKKITPFTAYVSASVFSSAENDPLKYVIKSFYPHKSSYPDQILKLHQLVEELETLKDAKRIIEMNKIEYRQYLGDVPTFVMKNDKTGFYSRLGFANVEDSMLTINYEFTYTSSGGMAQRSFAVPMTEETIVELIDALQNQLSMTAFVKEQRNLMTKKLRDLIKTRDNFTCCICANSSNIEPNLLLEIDHIIPVSKGGFTLEDNLQTLCWKCNRSKGSKIV